ncbi:uncharacterized protein EV420DRAFT_86284 [Desarmillaria tabescens]|uniref:Luciferase domain-containing protein n=1 Tax=Armillaria tabescens TaxID=1929756 RepID=A0AA39NQQ3_ARMTA|nr:uncharacterized protein EV420DRAFT_86284 [Desarmillaria tabescens]KAK0470046.1 hypothetical protein EV420DRAFT_86284 [Desarmillaria tabescens]
MPPPPRNFIIGVASAVAGVALAPVILPPALGVVGFGAAGPVAGTLAAAIQSGIGNVAAGSAFAVAQSIGMGGAIPAGVYAVSGIVGGIAGWAGGWFGGRESVSTEEYDQDVNTDVWLGEIPKRRDARPPLGWDLIPYRQLAQVPSDAMKKKLQELFDSIGTKNPMLVEYRVSPHEGHVLGIHIHSSISPPHEVARVSLLEISHIHTPDHLLHVVLAPQDCKQVIEKGWGERPHPFSGARRDISLPKEYLIIYGPRDDEELAVIECILKAGVGYMTNSREVV